MEKDYRRADPRRGSAKPFTNMNSEITKPLLMFGEDDGEFHTAFGASFRDSTILTQEETNFWNQKREVTIKNTDNPIIGEIVSVWIWSSKPKQIDTWEDNIQNYDPNAPNLKLIAPCSICYLEFGRLDTTNYDTNVFEDEDRFIPFYEKYFFGKDHTTLVGLDDEIGPIIINIEKGDEKIKTIIWTKKEDERIMLPTEKEKMKTIFTFRPEIANIKFKA